MGIQFDLRSAVFFNAVIGLVFFLYTLYFGRMHRTHPGFREWMLSSLFYFVSQTLIGLRGHIPDWASIVVGGNVLQLLTCTFLAEGLGQFFGQTSRLRWLSVPPVIGLITGSYFTYLAPNLAARIITVSLFTLPALVYGLWLMRLAARSFSLASSFWLVLTLGGLIALNLARAAETASADIAPLSDLMRAPISQSYFALLLSLFVLALYLGLLGLHSQRTEVELNTALVELNALEGMLPICSYCKKIRDEKGEWNQLEAYISDRSAAEFTHGYCPECATKFIKDL